MGGRGLQGVERNRDVLFSTSGLGFQWSPQENCFHPGGLFASVGQAGMGFGISPNSHDNGSKPPFANMYTKYALVQESGYKIVEVPELGVGEIAEEEIVKKKKKKKRGAVKLKIKIGNPSLRRLISGAIAGGVSRTAVAPLETIRTHLMVGSCGNSTGEVFQNIMKNDGWKGLFRGNFVNVIRVAPSKAIEVCILLVPCFLLGILFFVKVLNCFLLSLILVFVG